MGRKSLFQEKAEHIMISCSKEDREYVDSKGLSPSKIYQDAVIRIRNGNVENSKNMEFENDIEKVRVVFVKSERGLCKKESYFTAIQIFMDKWTDITKPEVMGRVERPRYYTAPKEEDEKDGEGNL